MIKTLTPHPTPRLLPPFLPPVCDHHQTCKTAKSVILRKLFKFRNQSSADHVVKESKKTDCIQRKDRETQFSSQNSIEAFLQQQQQRREPRRSGRESSDYELSSTGFMDVRFLRTSIFIHKAICIIHSPANTTNDHCNVQWSDYVFHSIAFMDVWGFWTWVYIIHPRSLKLILHNPATTANEIKYLNNK